MLSKICRIISIVFEPFLVSLLTVVVVLFRTSLSFWQSMIWLALAIVFGGLPPLAVLVYEKTSGKISDWFIFKREERRDVEIAWVAGSFLLSLLAFFLKAPNLLFALFLIYFLLGLVFTSINFFWKISVHAAMITLFVLVLTLFISPVFLLATALIFVVDFSRWYLKKHTLTQLSAGTFLTLVLAYAVLAFFNLASF